MSTQDEEIYLTYYPYSIENLFGLLKLLYLSLKSPKALVG